MGQTGLDKTQTWVWRDTRDMKSRRHCQIPPNILQAYTKSLSSLNQSTETYSAEITAKVINTVLKLKSNLHTHVRSYILYALIICVDSLCLSQQLHLQLQNWQFFSYCYGSNFTFNGNGAPTI